MRLGSGTALVVVPGKAPLCLRCRNTGHIRRYCRVPRCAGCRAFGHEQDGFTTTTCEAGYHFGRGCTYWRTNQSSLTLTDGKPAKERSTSRSQVVPCETSKGICSETLVETLGSDHHIIATSFPLVSSRRSERKVRKRTGLNFERRTPSPKVDGYNDCLAALTAGIDDTTQLITTTPINPDVDPHLLHMWDATSGLAKRWKCQRLNCKLKLRIARITRQAQEYARLSREATGGEFVIVCTTP
ncbi:hypothetical protein HPB51_025257 [Rhipicephalus microplus]|uniref:CCHC-type domain-containing protein n=1 Tax=Rhipicephalus microplus TaxID=6941 RepID=A0A9J6D7Q3_RHIMP|nr:hypothetical protein HPB51_025257 [Rhipicephalus microplus]